MLNHTNNCTMDYSAPMISPRTSKRDEIISGCAVCSKKYMPSISQVLGDGEERKNDDKQAPFLCSVFSILGSVS